MVGSLARFDGLRAEMCDHKNDNRIRVLHILADGRVGGPGVRIARLNDRLRHLAGEHLEIVVASPPVQPPDFFERAGIAHVELKVEKPNMERPVTSGLSWLCRGILQNLRRTLEVYREIEPVLIHVNGAVMIHAVIAARLRHIPAIWHINDNIVPQSMGPAVRWTARLCGTQLLATSKAVIDHYKLPDETPVIYPPGPRIEGRTKGEDLRSSHKIGVLANVVPPKRVHDAIEAMGLLKQDFPEMRLEIAGRILENKLYYYELLRNRVQELGLEDSVAFLGFLDDPIPWLKSLSVLVFPSESESAGLAIIEAMACSIPVVAADIPSTQEIAGGSGSVFPVGDVAALADSVRRLLLNRGQYDACVTRGRARAEQYFNVDTIASQLLAIYMSALGRTGGNGE